MVQVTWIAVLGGIAHAAVIQPFIAPENNPTPTRALNQVARALQARDSLESQNPDNPQVYLPGASGDWLTTSCDDKRVTNVNPVNMTQRYVDAGVPEAWSQVTKAWNAQLATPSPGTIVNENFTLFWSNAFKTPEGQVCNLESSSCNTVKCYNNGMAPAVYLMTNSLSYVKSIFTLIYQGFEEAGDEISNGLGAFVAMFAPIQKDTKKIAQIMLEIFLFAALALIPTGFAAFAGTAFLATGIGALVATLGANTMIAGSVMAHNFIANTLKDAETLSDKEAQLDKLINSYMTSIKQGLQATLDNLINPRDEENLDNLSEFVVDGRSNVVWLTLTQSGTSKAKDDLKSAAKKMIYASLLPSSWSTNDKNHYPFLLRVPADEYKCNSTLKDKQGADFKIDLGTYMENEVREKTIYCDKSGNSWFLLSGNTEKGLCHNNPGLGCQAPQKASKEYAFVALPGGDAWTLPQMTGITIEDIVLSQWAGFKENGGKNGFKPSKDTDKIVRDDGSTGPTDLGLPLSGGVRTPGAFQIPICLDYKKAASNIKSDKYTDGAPCGDESDYEVPVLETVGSDITSAIQDALDKAKKEKGNDD